MTLREKTAFVTGASQGIGRAIAVALAGRGATVALLARTEAALAAAAADVEAAGGTALVFAADVADRAAVSRAISETARRTGRIDILVNNAGMFEGAPFLETSDETWQRALDVNILSVVHCTRECLAHMVPRGSGHIINLASVAGRVATRMMSTYGVTKHALIGLTRCLALELLGKGIAVNAICPAMVETAMGREITEQVGRGLKMSGEAMRAALLTSIPLGRFLTPDEVAESVLWLVTMSAPLAYTGQCIDINGGRLFV